MPTPFDWRAFLTLAESLVNETASEAGLRTAISRAYYAAYGTAAQRLLAEGEFAGRGHISHRMVWQAFKDRDQPHPRRIGIRGDQLKQLRVHADYRTVFPGDLRRSADAAVRTARFILALLEDLPMEGTTERG